MSYNSCMNLKNKHYASRKIVSAAVMKIFLNYTQTIAILKNLQLEWGDILSQLFGTVEATGGSINQVYGLDCLLNIESYASIIIYIKTMIMLIIPGLFLLMILLFWIIRRCLKNHSLQFILERIFITGTMTLFFFQCPLITSLTQIMNCVDIGGNSYVSNFLVERCDSPTYNFWRIFITIPFFCFYTVFLPLLAFSYMLYHRNNLYEENIIYKIGYLLNGFREEYFVWYLILLY